MKKYATKKRFQRLRTSSPYLRTLFGTVLLVVTLYWAKPVIVPLALAILLAFVLTPAVRWVQSRGLTRVPAVMLVVGISILAFSLVAWGVGVQVVRLADDLPAHSAQIRQKVAKLRDSGEGVFSKMTKTLRDVTESDPQPDASKNSQTTVVSPPETSPVEHLAALATMVIEPLASGGLVLILVIFLLIKREDVRNRLIGILGHGRLTGTTRVLVGSGEGVSRYLLMQLGVNAAFGFVFGVALFFVGVQYWFLWGFITAVLRFIPYIGSWIAASLPVFLSFATSPGLAQPFLTLGIFIALDLLTANVIEPYLLGHSTGISPVALLVAAVFWTWIWGPIGLILSTPMTVCLVVLGQHVPRFRFLSLLLGDQPALPPGVAFYQRLLAGDSAEAKGLAITFAQDNGFERVADELLVPSLLFARRDRRRAGLTADDETFILDATSETLGEIVTSRARKSQRSRNSGSQQQSRAVAANEGGAQLVVPTSSPTQGHLGGEISPPALILGCPAHHRSEEIILSIASAAVAQSGATLKQVPTRLLPAELESAIALEHPSVLFIAILPPGGITQARYLCRRLRRRFSELRIVVGYFGPVKDFDRLLVRLRAAGADYVTTSIKQSQTQMLALIPDRPENSPPALIAAG